LQSSLPAGAIRTRCLTALFDEFNDKGFMVANLDKSSTGRRRQFVADDVRVACCAVEMMAAAASRL